MAYNFTDEPLTVPDESRRGSTGTVAPESPQAPAATAPVEAPTSPALGRFNTCRWQQPAENGNTAFCTHREVKPYAGTTGFDADAWCGDCQYFKLRRAPKKRSPSDDYSY